MSSDVAACTPISFSFGSAGKPAWFLVPQHSLLSQGHSSVIQDVQHSDAAARVDPAEAAAVVAEQWTQQAELNLGASSTYLQPPGLLVRLILLHFARNPAQFYSALLEGPELLSCRQQMQGFQRLQYGQGSHARDIHKYENHVKKIPPEV